MAAIDTMNQINNSETKESTQLIEIKPFTDGDINHEPLITVKTEAGIFLALGKYRLTDNFDTEDELKAYYQKNFWRILLDVITSIITTMQQYENAKATTESPNLSPQNVD